MESFPTGGVPRTYRGRDIHKRHAVSAIHDVATSAQALDFDVDICRQGRVGFVSVAGEIDIATASQLAESIAEICAQDVGEVVVDLRDVTFMDCSGVNVMIDARRTADESKMPLTFIPSARVVRVLEILELEQLARDP